MLFIFYIVSVFLRSPDIQHGNRRKYQSHADDFQRRQCFRKEDDTDGSSHKGLNRRKDGGLSCFNLLQSLSVEQIRKHGAEQAQP